MEALLNNAPCGFITLNDSGQIDLVNNTLLNLTGHSKVDLEGKPFEVLLNVAGKIFFQTHFFPMLKLHAKAEEIFISIKAKNGDSIPMVVNATECKDVSTAVYSCVFIPVYNRRKFEDEIIAAKRKAEYDLNEDVALKKCREEAENQSRQLDKRITQLININSELIQFNEIINHDMQECIRKITLYTKLYISDHESSSLETVLLSASRLRSINKSLNTFIGLGLNNEKFRSVGLNKIVEHARLSVEENMEFNQIEINCPPLPDIDALADQLQLLFYQLFCNSVKYRKENSVKIDISYVVYESNVYRNFATKYAFEEVVKIEIADYGAGFDANYKDKVIAFIKKLNNANTGIGIGLALCKKIVENHFGEIFIDSKEGEGTTVTITLPVKQSLS